MRENEERLRKYQVYHVWCNFYIVTTVIHRTTVIFGKLKDGALQINSSAFNNNCSSYRYVFQNGVKGLSKMVLKIPVFCQKAPNFVYFWQSGSNFNSMWFKHVSNNVGRDFRFPMLAFAKIHFPNEHFMLPLINADIGSLKFLQTLFDKHFDHMLVKFEQSRMVRNMQNFEVFGKKWLKTYSLTSYWGRSQKFQHLIFFFFCTSI